MKTAFNFNTLVDMSNRKPLLVLGKPGTGKSALAERIKMTFKEEETLTINGRDFNDLRSPLAISAATTETKLLIIDDLPGDSLTGCFLAFSHNYYNGSGGGLRVNRLTDNSFIIDPAMIITSDISLEEFNAQSESFKRRFNAIEL